jgi:hypothetical protein
MKLTAKSLNSFHEKADPCQEWSRADVVLRDGWDSKPLRNLVKGKSEGLSNSNVCQFPHLSISADTTRDELKRKLPEGVDQNGFGNRFLYCYVRRVKLCPNGGPRLDWPDEMARLRNIITLNPDVEYVAVQRAAAKVWNRMYAQIEDELRRLPGLTAAMCARAAAHVRRLALIFCLLDGKDALETEHLQAAKRIWDYCQDSARYVFSGLTADQSRILGWIAKQSGPVTFSQIREDMYQRHKKADWIRAQVDGLLQAGGKIVVSGDAIAIKP